MIRSVTRIAVVTCLLASTAHADPALSYKRLYVRAGILHISPLSDSRELTLSGVDGPASLAVMEGPIAGSGATLDPLTIPAVIAGYVLPILDNRLSLETVLSTPIHVTFSATGTLADMSIAPEALGIETGVPALGSALGEADAAPPILTLVYRIADLGPVHPYAGTGLGVLVTYNARASNPLLTEVGQPKFDIDPAPGLVLQTGVDLKLWRRVVARLDVKYIAFMKAHATVENLRVRTPGIPLFETAEVGTATMDMWVNPLILQIGGGRRLVIGAADILTRDEIRALTQRSNLAGTFAIAWSWLVIVGCFVSLALVPHPLVFVAAVIILGGRQLALAVTMHEAAHGTLFRTRWLNEVLTDWLCARPVWADVARYRTHHLAHHAHTGTDRDPDLGLALAEPMSRGSLVRKIVRDVTGASGLRRVVGLLAIDAELLRFDVGGGPRRGPLRSVGYHLRALVMNVYKPILANAVILTVLYVVGYAWVFLAWVVAYLTMFSLVIRIRSLAEHACTARTADQLLNTRTTRAGLFARTIFAPLHVNYHLEHHLLPTVPWWRLPALHRTLSARDVIPPSSLARGYLHVLHLVSSRTS